MAHSQYNSKKEISLIDLQLIVSLLSILVIIISIILLYNQQLNLKHEKTLLSPKEAYYLSLFNRILALTAVIMFLYINYQLYYISKEEGENLKPYTLQIGASYLTVFAAAIVLYVVITSKTETIPDIENPII